MSAARANAVRCACPRLGRSSYEGTHEINAHFVEQFVTVRSPLDLVTLQVNFLEEHRVAMLDFARQWTKQSEG